MSKTEDEKIMDELLGLWDWYRRICDDDYQYGYTDAIGQCILNVGKVLGEGKWNVGKQEFELNDGKKYKYEAYKRVMEDTTQEAYWEKYPTPIASYFPEDVIRQHGGVLAKS